MAHTRYDFFTPENRTWTDLEIEEISRFEEMADTYETELGEGLPADNFAQDEVPVFNLDDCPF